MPASTSDGEPNGRTKVLLETGSRSWPRLPHEEAQVRGRTVTAASGSLAPARLGVSTLSDISPTTEPVWLWSFIRFRKFQIPVNLLPPFRPPGHPTRQAVGLPRVPPPCRLPEPSSPLGVPVTV